MWWWPGGTWVSALEFPHADSQVPLKALGCSFSSYHTRPTAPIWLLSWPENYFSHTLLRTTTKHLDIFLDVIVKVKVIQLCLTLCDPMDYTVHGILQARILEWVAIPSSRGSYQGSPRILEWVACPWSSRFSWPRHWTPEGLLHCRQILFQLSCKSLVFES